MSFGFSVGDFVAVGQLAWSVYKACKDAPEEYREVAREVCSLHIALKELEDDAGNPNSLINRRGISRRAELLALRDNIQVALRELEDIVHRYQSLSKKGKLTWTRIRFASKEFNTIRGKLTFYTSAIGLFKQSLSVGSLARIEEKLDELVREVREGKRPEGSITSVYSTDNAFSWSELERELEGEGIPIAHIRLHREHIKVFLRNLMVASLAVRGSSSSPASSYNYTRGSPNSYNHTRRQASSPASFYTASVGPSSSPVSFYTARQYANGQSPGPEGPKAIIRPETSKYSPFHGYELTSHPEISEFVQVEEEEVTFQAEAPKFVSVTLTPIESRVPELEEGVPEVLFHHKKSDAHPSENALQKESMPRPQRTAARESNHGFGNLRRFSLLRNLSLNSRRTRRHEETSQVVQSGNSEEGGVRMKTVQDSKQSVGSQAVEGARKAAGEEARKAEISGSPNVEETTKSLLPLVELLERLPGKDRKLEVEGVVIRASEGPKQTGEARTIEMPEQRAEEETQHTYMTSSKDAEDAVELAELALDARIAEAWRLMEEERVQKKEEAIKFKAETVEQKTVYKIESATSSEIAVAGEDTSSQSEDLSEKDPPEKDIPQIQKLQQRTHRIPRLIERKSISQWKFPKEIWVGRRGRKVAT